MSVCLFLQDGQRGHLEGLASVYCELLMAPFGDVITALESARQAAWAERSPLNRSTGGGSSSGGACGGGGGSSSSNGGGGAGGAGAGGSAAMGGSSSGGGATGRSGGQSSTADGTFGGGGGGGGVCINRGHRGSLQHGGLPNSHSQPIYVPGKYSVSVLAYEWERASAIFMSCPHTPAAARAPGAALRFVSRAVLCMFVLFMRNGGAGNCVKEGACTGVCGWFFGVNCIL